MKKYFILALRYSFYLSALLFFDEPVRIAPIILLMSTLFLENKYYIILPLVLCFYSSSTYIILILATLVYHILFYKFIKKNRYYALAILFISLLTANLVPLINQQYDLSILYVSLFCFVLYAPIQYLYVFYNKGNKHLTILLNDKLLHLFILLGYLFLISFYNPNPLLYSFLFMQLFIISEISYNAVFFILCIFIYYLRFKILYVEGLTFLAISFLPPVIAIQLDYTNALSYAYVLYSILILLVRIKRKSITIEHNYINTLFHDFKCYLNDLNIEYDKLNTLKELKEGHLEQIQQSFCSYCHEDSICRYKLDKRYSFLCNAMNNQNNNIYHCPHYNEFFFNTKVGSRTSFLQFNAITSLADELEFLYAQNIKMAKSYNKYIQDLSFYSYTIENLDINLASSTIYFSLTLNKNKQIIQELFLKLAYKAFHETLDLKVIEEEKNYIVYIYKKPRVQLEYAHKILAKNENIISGDNYYIKKDYNDSYVFALSDGMGSGHNAYIESSEALKKISHLSTYHFSLKTILKLLENIYDLKCEYDSYATLDILNINTSDMKLNLYKLGSSTSYIYHNDELRAFENKALPLKLDDINSSYELEYFKDDIIILCSDGISDFITPLELKNEIDFTKSAEEIMLSILGLLKYKEPQLKDDASLIVIRVV